MSSERWSKKEVLGRSWPLDLYPTTPACGHGLFVKVMGDTGSVAPECSTAESLYRELSLLICLIPILQADLTMENDGEVTCSDASESGGAVAKAESLTCLAFHLWDDSCIKSWSP